jgi:hypothetical protein
MAYTDRTSERSASYDMESHAANAVIDYHDRVRWGPILASLVVALSIISYFLGLIFQPPISLNS